MLRGVETGLGEMGEDRHAYAETRMVGGVEGVKAAAGWQANSVEDKSLVDRDPYRAKISFSCRPGYCREVSPSRHLYLRCIR